MKEKFIDKNFSKKTLAVLGLGIQVIEEYQADGFELTVRQVYYQMIARDLFPESWRDPVTHSKNNPSSYRKLKDMVNNGRLAGLVDWDAIVDRTRTDRGNSHWDDPEGVIRSAATWYAKDSRKTQEFYVEVWVEKDALIGIVGSVARDLDVRYLSCRGFTSQSAMYQAAERFIDQEHGDKKTSLLYLGDHDPSSLDMVRDIQDRLEMFGSNVRVIQIALNKEQIAEFNPPPNPAKITDSRYEKYQRLHGSDSWELDALDPKVIERIIRDGVKRFTDEPARRSIIAEQELERNQLKELATRYDTVVDFLEENE